MVDLSGESEESFLKKFYIPSYFLVPELQTGIVTRVPTCPVIFFINTKSRGQASPRFWGQLGAGLLLTCHQILNPLQVFDLGEDAPDKVLCKIYDNLERLISDGDNVATEIQKRLRLIVAGGDGTESWLFRVIKLVNAPPIATIPLGTGNNIPFSLGWGKKNPGTDRQSIISILNKVSAAREMKIDSWDIVMRMKLPKVLPCNAFAPVDLPRTLGALRSVPKTDSENMDNNCAFNGAFWNYFSMGMDAQVSYAFHSERKLHPENFKNQLLNQCREDMLS